MRKIAVIFLILALFILPSCAAKKPAPVQQPVAGETPKPTFNPRVEELVETAKLGNYVRVKEILYIYPGLVNAVSTRAENTGFTALHMAAGEGKKDVVELLISKQADVNLAKKPNNISPLHYAVLGGNVDVLKMLIEKGAEVNAKDVAGQTPLFLATIKKNPDVVKLLITSGADVDAGNSEGKAPIHIAAEMGDRKIGDILLENGADVNNKTKSGLTAFDLASEKGQRKFLELLRKNGGFAANELKAQEDMKQVKEAMEKVKKQADKNKGKETPAPTIPSPAEKSTP
jgi:ankyrin repeat protein